MKPTAEQQEPEYIITREQLTQIANLVYPTDYQELTNVFGVIRSRPHSPLQDTTAEQEPEYIITEKRLFEWVLQSKITKGEADIVRSRSYTAPLTQDTTDCPYHTLVFCNVFDNNAPMEHHCDFLNDTCEVEEEKIRQDEREKVLEMLNKRKTLNKKVYISNPEMKELGKIRIEEIDGIIESLRAGKDGEV